MIEKKNSAVISFCFDKFYSKFKNILDFYIKNDYHRNKRQEK